MKMSRLLSMLAIYVAISSPRLQAQCPHSGLCHRLGICTSVQNAPVVKAAQGNYVEVNISGFLMPEKSDAEFQKNLEMARASELPITSANGFYPPDIILVGPNADEQRAVKYAETAMRRASMIGIKTAVLGSGKARNIPEGFPKEKAREQFVALCKRLAPIAEKYGITIVIEPLRKQETNFINTVLEGLDIVKAVKHPNVQLLADFYHMAHQDESPRSLIKAGKHLRHVHVAEKVNRTAPGIEGDDFTPYLQALAKIKYGGNISFECGWKDFSKEAAPSLQEMRRQLRGQ